MEEYFSKLESDRLYSSRVVSALRQMDLDKIDIPLIVSLLKYISLNMGDGAVLVFLPGIGGGERGRKRRRRGRKRRGRRERGEGGGGRGEGGGKEEREEEKKEREEEKKEREEEEREKGKRRGRRERGEGGRGEGGRKD